MSYGTVLFVDDDPTVRRAVRTLLTQHLGPEHPLEVAESGDEALEIFRELQEDHQPLSVVISDFIMPGMRGDELLVRIHELSPRTIKIMLTGQSDYEGVKRAIARANLYRFMEKPFNNADLVLTVRAAQHGFSETARLMAENAELREQLSSLTQELAALRAAR